jgi:hypothetical protein
MEQKDNCTKEQYDCPLRSGRGRPCSAYQVHPETPTGVRIFNMDGWTVEVSDPKLEPCKALFWSLEQQRENLGLAKIESLQSYVGKLPACAIRAQRALKSGN